MLRLRSPRPFLGVLLALTVVASATRGQPATRISPPVVFYAALFLGDERLHKELKLTPEQVKKVTAFNQSASPGFFGAKGVGKKTEANPEVKAREKELAEILKPEQSKRLKEIVYQQLDRIPAGPVVLAGDEEFAKAVKLTDDQRKRLRGREAIAAVLTNEQQTEWKTLHGAPYAEQLVPTLASGFRTLAAPPTALQYLAAYPVRMDLKLTDKQKADTKALQEKWQKAAPRTTIARNAEETKKTQAQVAEFEKEARAILDARQIKRLDQIILQQSLTNGRESDVFTHRDVVAGLKMNDKQQEQIRTARDERQKALLAVFTSDDEIAEIAKKVNEHKKDTYKQLHALLTAEQQTSLKDIVGEAFQGEIPAIRGGILGGGLAPSAITTPIYLIMPGVVTYSTSPALHKELKLTEGQIAKLQDLQTKARSDSRIAFSQDEESEKKRKAQAESLEKELAGILDAGQMKRFKQLVLQTYTSSGTGRTLPPPLRNMSLSRIAEVRETLKLTDEQKTKLQGGSEIETILDAGQLAKWKDMLGERFEGNLRPTFLGGPGGRAQSATLTLQALETKAVQEELKLSEKQLKALPEMVKKYQEKAGDAARNPNFQDFMKARQAAQAELDEACKKLLDVTQAKRFDEILLQHANRGGLNALLLQPAAITGLALDEKQRERLANLRRDNTELTTLFRREFISAPRSGRNEQTVKAQADMTAQFDKKVEQVLTDAQKDKLKRLLGQPFKGTIDTPRGLPGGFVGP